jgi:transcriptional regulator
MYIPKPFQVDDPQRLYRFIRENSFGILFSGNDGQLMATHLPLER